MYKKNTSTSNASDNIALGDDANTSDNGVHIDINAIDNNGALIDIESMSDNDSDNCDCDNIDNSDDDGGDNDGMVDSDTTDYIDSTPKITGAVDDMDDITDPEPTYEERVARALANNPTTPCSRDKTKDDKFGKIFTYASIPFFLISIGFSLFNMGKIRYPLSFLFLSFAMAVLSVGHLLRYINNKKCNCSLCETQAKSFLMSTIIWALVGVGCMIAFVVTILK